MNILIYTQSYYVRKNFVNALIPNGISLFHSENIKDVVTKISSKPIDIVLFDVINENYEEPFRVMTAMKNSPSEKVKKIGIIMLIGTIDKKSLTQCLQLGASGFIKSDSSQDFIAKYIMQTYEKLEGTPPQRKYIRVTLSTEHEEERIAVKFRSPKNMQLIMGVIQDISAGGIAVELVGTYDPEAIEKGTEVMNMQFILEGRDVIVNAVVVAYQQNFCAFRFTSISHQDRESISQFIFEKIENI